MNYTLEDFTDGLAPFEYVYSLRNNPFQHERTLKAMSDYAKSVGFIGFTKQYKAYLKTMQKESVGVQDLDNPTCFTGQPMELNAGNWTADDAGVTREGYYGPEQACAHPIMPVERLVNIDTGEEKMRIAYKRGAIWRTLIVDKRVLASASKITDLAASGVLVTSENAKPLIRYLSDLDALNYDTIPEAKSVGRLGYIRGEGFSPYVEGLTFDGDANFRSLFQAVTHRGSRKRWAEIALECREMSTTAKIMLAASFASALVEPLGALPFFVHLWGVDSGTGKTVALMLAASVWGDPSIGAYIKTFDATVVGHEKTAAFLNHLPLCLDELQLAKDSKGRTNFDVYKLAQGVGRTRGNRGGGVDLTPTWKNTILTTGESPLTGQSAGAGAVNRVIDIECVAGQPVITDGRRVSALLKGNYGFAGQVFAERLYRDGDADNRVSELYNGFFRTLSQSDTTEKQAMAAAAILTADTLASEWVFGGKVQPLTVEEISTFLASKASVSLGERFYSIIIDWIVKNRVHFVADMDSICDVYGVLDGNIAYIIRSEFDRIANENGVSPKAALSYFRQQHLIDLPSGRGFAKRKRINGLLTDVIALHLREDYDGESASEYDELPL